MRMSARAGLLLSLLAAPAGLARADALSGSPSSMAHQHRIAVREDYSFLRTPKDVQTLATTGALVPVTESEDLALSKVSYPLARPEVRGFVERFAADFRAATGSRLVVTSLTRPAAEQPRNAHKLSVHPAGMAVDFRVPADSAGRAYLETALLALERAGVLDVTRERSPAHYHVAVFAEAYAPWAARHDSLAAVERARVAAEARSARTAAASPPRSSSDEFPLPAFVVGLLALAGMTAPVIYRGSRTRARG
ncbi:MAG TPA: DUF5715 family protein [Gemmatimonadaceae bacterium]|nr:DUF5715 family protein [Gemmatimonadaceae bacterium]